jgi:hypothetical protein
MAARPWPTKSAILSPASIAAEVSLSGLHGEVARAEQLDIDLAPAAERNAAWRAMAAGTDPYLTIQQDILETSVDRGQLRQLAEPTRLPNGRWIPGLKLDHPRQLAVMHASRNSERLVERIEHSRPYRLLPAGYRLCVVFLKLFERVYPPLTAGLLRPVTADPALTEDKRHQLDRLYQRIVTDLDALWRAVGLKGAA